MEIKIDQVNASVRSVEADVEIEEGEVWMCSEEVRMIAGPSYKVGHLLNSFRIESRSLPLRLREPRTFDSFLSILAHDTWHLWRSRQPN